mmetsp:Transcript_8529/g.26530  ORF Transcript_8529/g.26530 Transcript_8529/m.26530 type:complete len:320 (+) Transcript_8529:446-1405(+)
MQAIARPRTATISSSTRPVTRMAGVAANSHGPRRRDQGTGAPAVRAQPREPSARGTQRRMAARPLGELRPQRSLDRDEGRQGLRVLPDGLGLLGALSPLLAGVLGVTLHRVRQQRGRGPARDGRQGLSVDLDRLASPCALRLLLLGVLGIALLRACQQHRQGLRRGGPGDLLTASALPGQGGLQQRWDAAAEERPGDVQGRVALPVLDGLRPRVDEEVDQVHVPPLGREVQRRGAVEHRKLVDGLAVGEPPRQPGGLEHGLQRELLGPPRAADVAAQAHEVPRGLVVHVLVGGQEAQHGLRAAEEPGVADGRLGLHQRL